MAVGGAARDSFGHSVAIYGERAIVGAYRHDENGRWCGAAYVFERSGEGWSQKQKLVPSDGAKSGLRRGTAWRT